MSKGMEWVKSHKPHVAALAVAVIAAICLAVAAACGVFSPSALQAEQEESSAARLTIGVAADSGWDGESTPAIAHIVGEGVDFYHAINPDAEGNKGASTVELTEGDYTVSLISPFNRDGSAYELYGTSEEQQVALEAGGELSVDFVMMLIAAEDVTDETVQSIVWQTRLAVENGDETLKGDAGRSILDRLVQNAAANPNASDETKQEATDADKEVDVDGQPEATTPSGGNGNASDAGNGDSGFNAGNSGSNGNGSGSSGGSSNQPSAPAHSHSWKDHTATRQVWVPNIVTVTDYADQQAPVGTQYVFAEDGFVTTDSNAAKAHAAELVKQGYFGNYRMETIYETQRVPVGSHEEDQGWYETETYVDYRYCDCGATK